MMRFYHVSFTLHSTFFHATALYGLARHLEDIKNWREKELSKLGFPLQYPLWQSPYKDLEAPWWRRKIAKCHFKHDGPM